MFSQIFNYLISQINYLTIFLLMVLESSFIPFPSEIILVPAGFLAANGELNLFLAIIIGAIASVVGALINYYIAKNLGRKYLLKNKKFFFIKIDHLKKTEKFFKKHGNKTTFIARLIPVFRQYVSLPAGFSNMNIFKFSFYTFLGALIWTSFLVLLGFFLKELANQILFIYKLIILIIIIVIIILLIYFFKKRNIYKTE